jgi:Tfp pilus assembly protein PilZ
VSEDRSLAVFGVWGDATVRRLRDAAASVGAATTVVERCEDAPAVLADLDPVAIVLRTAAAGADQACAHVRSQARFAHVPVFGVADERSDLSFTELFSWGGDDLVTLDSPRPVVRRLRPLLARAASAASAASHRSGDMSAIVAGPDARWRSVMGRALYHGGFSVRFVSGGADLAEESLAEGVRVVVTVDDLAPDGAPAALSRARARGSEAAWIVVAPPKRMRAVHAAVATQGRAAVADGFAPPENALFLANELLARRGVDQRASARLLYGTTVAFRAAGRDEDDIGFSYNVSAGGAYVRTLAPLDAGQEVWLEMWPPRSERRVRLIGTVAWKRPFGPHERATVPAGFGVKITAGLGDDLERWRAGYEAFADSLFGRACG